MDKSANTQFPILDALAERWSPRSFADRPVEPEQIGALFEAARWAASSYNEQPWRFILASKDDPPGYDKLLGCLVEANQQWARTAPLIGLTVAQQAFSKNDKPNRCCEHDIGLAMGNLSIQATALGLCVHQMAGIDQDQARAVYDIPDGYHAFSGFAVGYEGEPDALPEDWMRQAETAPRDRKPFDEFVFGDTFGTPSGLIPSP
jgi:nitroreductase